MGRMRRYRYWGGGHATTALTVNLPTYDKESQEEFVPPRVKRIRQQGDDCVPVDDEQFLLDLPVELFAEICSYLAPLDIRSLCMTNRDLSRILLSADAQRVWKVSRNRTYPSMPPCPEGMSEFHYVSLMFLKQCMECEKDASEMDLYHGTKFCEECWRTHFMTRAKVTRDFPGFPHDLLADPSTFHRGDRLTARPFLKLAMERHYTSFESLPEGDSDEAVTALKEYTEALGKKHADRIVLVDKLRTWMREENRRQHDVTYRIYDDRRQSIVAKMEALGYNEMDVLSRRVPFDKIGMMHKLHNVTEDEWLEMRPDLETHASEARELRLENEKNTRLFHRRNQIRQFINREIGKHPTFGLGNTPYPDDVLGVAEVNTLLEEDTAVVTREAWEAVSPAAASFIHSRRLQALLSYWNIVKGLPEDSVPDVDITPTRLSEMAEELSLITSCLICSHCRELIWFDNALWHLRINNLTMDTFRAVPSSCKSVIPAVLADCELAEDTKCTSPDVAGRDKWFACSRCDDRVTKMSSFKDLLSHYVLSKVWFEDATAAATERETTYPHLAPSETLPVIIDIHDISRPGLCRELSSRDRGTLTRKQNRFARQLEYDLEDDIDDFENDAVLKQYRPSGKLVTRICKLCPVGYSPLPMAAAALRLHLETRHGADMSAKKGGTLHVYNAPLPAQPCI